jgi:hypothetical protein
MDSTELRNLHEAYLDVYEQEEEVLDEAITSEKGKAKAKEMIASRTTPSGRAKSGQGASVAAIKHIGRSNREGLSGTPMTPTMAKNPVKSASYGGTGNKAARRAGTYSRFGYKESYDLYDIILSHLLDEGYADTQEAAERIMVNMSEEWREDILAEAITSEKGKAKAAEMIAARSTPSGRAKSGKGANVAQIRQIRGSGRGDFDREGLGGTPMTPTMAKNPIKKQNYTGTGNKAARRAGLTPTRENPNAWKEEVETWVNSLIEEGYDLSSYTWEEMYEMYVTEGDNYDKNRQRAAKRAAERNAARDAGKTGNVPGVGYVTPRRERETYVDAAGTTRHKSGAKMPK